MIISVCGIPYTSNFPVILRYTYTCFEVHVLMMNLLYTHIYMLMNCTRFYYARRDENVYLDWLFKSFSCCTGLRKSVLILS